MVAEKVGRLSQTNRTRKALLQAASRLMNQGRKLTLDEVAEEAEVSRATAYRYFSSVDALLVEAPIDGAVPDPDDLFRDVAIDDPVERLIRVETALQDMISANEPSLRLMLAHSLQRGLNGEGAGELPVRQNRRTALIAAALMPARRQFKPSDFKALTRHSHSSWAPSRWLSSKMYCRWMKPTRARCDAGRFARWSRPP